MRIKSVVQLLSIVGGLTIFTSCSPKLLVKNDESIKEIAVCTQISSLISDSLKTQIDSVTNKFIEDYNSENNKYQLIQCQNDNTRSLYLDVLRISITNPGTQAGGVVLTTLGAITPFVMIAMGSPIYVWFAYLPRSTIAVNMNLSKDISQKAITKPRSTFAGSGKYFGSYENQKALLFNGYYNRLKSEMKNIENQYTN
jgi:hypothetical protein